MNYELVFILSPKISEKETNEKIAKIEDLLKENSASDIKKNVWGKRALAYSIKHFSDGFYVQLNFNLDADKIDKIDKKLKLEEEIIRFLIVREEKKISKALSSRDKKEVSEEKKKEDEKENINIKKEEKKPEKKLVKQSGEEKDFDKKLDEVLEKDLTD